MPVSGSDTTVADQLAHDVVALVRLVRRVDPVVHRSGLDGASFALLGRLAAEGPRRSGEIAAAVCADPSTISRQVAALVRAGLAERRSDPGDGRASLVAATAEGHRVLDQESRRRAARLAAVLDGWTTEDRGALGALLARFVADLRQHERDIR